MGASAGKDCEAIRLLMSAELDGATTIIEEARIVDHVNRCAACVRVRSEYVALAAATAPLVSVPAGPSAAAWEGVERHVSAGLEARRPGRMSPLRRAAVAAAIVLALGIGFEMGRITSPEPRAGKERASREEEKAAVAILDALVVGGAGADWNVRVRSSQVGEPTRAAAPGKGSRF